MRTVFATRDRANRISLRHEIEPDAHVNAHAYHVQADHLEESEVDNATAGGLFQWLGRE